MHFGQRAALHLFGPAQQGLGLGEVVAHPLDLPQRQQVHAQLLLHARRAGHGDDLAQQRLRLVVAPDVDQRHRLAVLHHQAQLLLVAPHTGSDIGTVYANGTLSTGTALPSEGFVMKLDT